MIPTPDLSIFDEGSNDVERCGVIVRRPDGSSYVVELPNRSDNPKSHFVASKTDARNLILPKEDLIIGVVHTHPFRAVRTASQHDIDSIPEGLIGMVYHPSSGSTVWYSRTGIVHEQLKRRR